MHAPARPGPKAELCWCWRKWSLRAPVQCPCSSHLLWEGCHSVCAPGVRAWYSTEPLSSTKAGTRCSGEALWPRLATVAVRGGPHTGDSCRDPPGLGERCPVALAHCNSPQESLEALRASSLHPTAGEPLSGAKKARQGPAGPGVPPSSTAAACPLPLQQTLLLDLARHSAPPGSEGRPVPPVPPETLLRALCAPPG